MKQCKLRFVDEKGTRRERDIKAGESVYFSPCKDKDGDKLIEVMVIKDADYIQDGETWDRCSVVNISVSKL